MLEIISHCGNVHQHHNILFFTNEDSYGQKKKKEREREITNISQNVEKSEHSHISDGMENGATTLENNIVIPQMVFPHMIQQFHS